MPIITVQTDRLRLVVLPEAGASLVAFEGRFGDAWLPLMRPTPPEAVATLNPSPMASFTLVPWSNRIVDARFTFHGRVYQLRANTPQGWAIHGDGRHRRWRVVSSGADALTCRLDSRAFADYNFPFPLTADVRYALTDGRFDTTLTLTNAGETAMPAGFGFHPYFNRGFGAAAVDEVQLQIKLGGVYPPLPGLDASPITTPVLPGTNLPLGMHEVPSNMDFAHMTAVGARDINHCFSRWDGRATLAYPSSGVRLEFECDPALGHVVIFTPPGKPFIAVEPVTNAIDGFNLFDAGLPDTGIRALEPGEQFSATFSIHLCD